MFSADERAAQRLRPLAISRLRCIATTNLNTQAGIPARSGG
jgi:hypothetical protein